MSLLGLLGLVREPFLLALFLLAETLFVLITMLFLAEALLLLLTGICMVLLGKRRREMALLMTEVIPAFGDIRLIVITDIILSILLLNLLRESLLSINALIQVNTLVQILFATAPVHSPLGTENVVECPDRVVHVLLPQRRGLEGFRLIPVGRVIHNI